MGDGQSDARWRWIDANGRYRKDPEDADDARAEERKKKHSELVSYLKNEIYQLVEWLYYAESANLRRGYRSELMAKLEQLSDVAMDRDYYAD